MAEGDVTVLPWDHLECQSDHERSPSGPLTCDNCLRTAIQFLKPHLVRFGFSAVEVMALMTTQTKELDMNKRLAIIRKDKDGKDSSAALLIDYLLSMSPAVINIFMRSLHIRPPVDVHDTIVVTCVCLSAHRSIIHHVANLLAKGHSLQNFLSVVQPNSADDSATVSAGPSGVAGQALTNQGTSSDTLARAIHLFASLYFQLAHGLRECLQEYRDTNAHLAWWKAVAATLGALPGARCHMQSPEITAKLFEDALAILRHDPYMGQTDNNQAGSDDTTSLNIENNGSVFSSNMSVISSSTDEWNNLAKGDLLQGMPPRDLADLMQLSEGSITLRPYQEELLESARRGRNVLIWLDTGAGKTYIVLKYAEEHLKGDEKRRMVFVVPKVRLAQQQFARFQRYLPSCNPHLRCGPTNSRKKPMLSFLIERYGVRIFVVTAQCLVEALDRKEVTLNQFSLMVLDECHHTRGGHPFKQLMNQYMELKFGSPVGSVTLPQIIGLTASPGIGRLRGGKPEQAVQHLYSLTASLDIEEICSVRRNLQDLEQHVARPKHDIRSFEKRTSDKFKDHIKVIMQEITKNMQDHPAVTEYSRILQTIDSSKAERFKKSLVPPSIDSKEGYSEWLNSCDKQFLYVQEPSVRYTILTCVDTLKIYLQALILHEECQAIDALSFLKEEIERMRSSSAERANVDMELVALFDANLPLLETAAKESENPKLKVLEEFILSGIKSSSQDTEQKRLELSFLNSRSLDSQQLEEHHIGEQVVGFLELNNLSSKQIVDENMEEMCEDDDNIDAMSVRTTTVENDHPRSARMQILDDVHDDDNDDAMSSLVDDIDSASVMECPPGSECEEEVRGMIFVRTLELTRLIPRWINRHPKLSWLNPGRITGATASASQGGMTKKEVAEVMEDFNRGVHKMLVCTSAAEEGLDFRACNLVIRYDYESSLVSMIQTRGRARQKDALYGVLVNPQKDSMGKEQQNINSELLMREAVASFQDLVGKNREDHLDTMARTQFQNYQKRWKKDMSEARSLREKLPDALYQLLCRRCCAFACNSSDVKRLKSTNHVVIGPNFRQRYSKVNSNVEKKKQYDKDLPKTGNLVCNRCGEPWGIIVKCISENLEFPIIKIDRFCLENEEKDRFLVKKWSKAFPVPEFGDEDRKKHRMSLPPEAGPLPVKDDNALNVNLVNFNAESMEFLKNKVDFPMETKDSNDFEDSDLEDAFDPLGTSDLFDEENEDCFSDMENYDEDEDEYNLALDMDNDYED